MYSFEYRKLPLDSIESDPQQPRQDLHIHDKFGAQLQASINKHGVLVALAVRQLDGLRYMVIDGHRRLICARRLGLLFVPCQVYTDLPDKDVARLRFELQGNWKPPRGYGPKAEEELRRRYALLLLEQEYNLQSNRQFDNDNSINLPAVA